MLKISIAAVIPLYNGACFIREALDSVLAQTEPVDEIIVVNDGSTDDSPAIVEEMAARHPIKLLHKTNGGQSSARNMGIAATNCTHIALLDQDDVWYPDHVRALKQVFIEDPDVGLAYGNIDLFDVTRNRLVRNFLDNFPDEHPKRSLRDCLSSDMRIFPSATLFRKDLFDRMDGFDERLSGYEDDDLFIRMFAAGAKFVYVNRAILLYRSHSQSSTHSRRMSDSRMIYFRKVLQMFPDEAHPAVVAPRFVNAIASDFRRYAKQRNYAMMEASLSDLQEIAQSMPKRAARFVQRRIALVSLASQLELYSVSRFLIRRCHKRLLPLLASAA